MHPWRALEGFFVKVSRVSKDHPKRIRWTVKKFCLLVSHSVLDLLSVLTIGEISVCDGGQELSPCSVNMDGCVDWGHYSYLFMAGNSSPLRRIEIIKSSE